MLAFFRQSVAALRLLLVLTVLLGVLYPGVLLAAGRLVPDRADGAPVSLDGRVVGSALLGQPFTGDRWFLPRPPATGQGYDPLASGGSNLGPDNAGLLAMVLRRRAEVAAREGVAPSAVPPDAVTASASGLDPDISPRYAAMQLPRVARARGLDRRQVAELVRQTTSGRTWGFIGEPRVDVLQLNLALLHLDRSRR